MTTTTQRLYASIGALAGLVVAVAGLPAAAATPQDTLVIAKNIDDIITLDPAEVFEFSGGEMSNQFYDRVMAYEADSIRPRCSSSRAAR